MRYWWMAAAVFALLGGGCSWSDVLITEIKSVPASSSFGYREGYASGCRSAIERSGGYGFDKPLPVTRDEQRARAERNYASGWDDGAGGCTARYAGRGAPYEAPGR